MKQRILARIIEFDVPIAWRKGVRSCTKHPISNHLVYSRLSLSYRMFTAKIDEVQIPRNINEAFQSPPWK